MSIKFILKMILYFFFIQTEKKTDGSWSPWGQWTSCPSKCTQDGGARIKRYRQCNMPPPMFGGKPCPGSSMEETFGCYSVCPGLLLICNFYDICDLIFICEFIF